MQDNAEICENPACTIREGGCVLQREQEAEQLKREEVDRAREVAITGLMTRYRLNREEAIEMHQYGRPPIGLFFSKDRPDLYPVFQAYFETLGRRKS
jgi:hypothetical protein